MVTLYTISFDSLYFKSIIFPNFSHINNLDLLLYSIPNLWKPPTFEQNNLFTLYWTIRIFKKGWFLEFFFFFLFLFLAVYTCSFFLLLLGSTLDAYLLQPTTKNLCPLKVTFLWSGNLGITNCGSDLTSLQPIPLSLSILTRPRGMEMGTCYNLLGTTLLERIKKPSSRVIPAVFRS